MQLWKRPSSFLKKAGCISALVLVLSLLVIPTMEVSAASINSTPHVSESRELAMDLSSSRSVVRIALYYDLNFTWKSEVEPRTFELDCDAVSLAGVCQNGATDKLVCHIIDKSHGGLYSAAIPFDANGMDSVTTVKWYFPKGKYDIYFTGSSDILKTQAVASFVAED